MKRKAGSVLPEIPPPGPETLPRDPARKESLIDRQGAAVRDPGQVLAGGSFDAMGLAPESLEYVADDAFGETLARLGITLFVTREYEHLVMALTGDRTGRAQGSVQQTFVSLPHPSGLAVDREKNAVYIAATRNPNRIVEFRPAGALKDRTDGHTKVPAGQQRPAEAPTSARGHAPRFLMPARAKYYAGYYYFHDLAVVGGELYANSVGQNGVIKVDMNSVEQEDLTWWPMCVERTDNQSGTRIPETRANYIQMNSISGVDEAGDGVSGSTDTSHTPPTIADCYFSASCAELGDRKPGDLDWKVDRRGVIFSGKTREVFATGLTRPHSARMHRGVIWVDNSGYGEVGIARDGTYEPQIKLPGWTRGLAIVDDVMFVGVSRVLPKFSVYAPGLDVSNAQTCGIYAIDMKTMSVIGSIVWPYANQIFAIDWLPDSVTPGFAFDTIQESAEGTKQLFYRYVI